MYLFLYYLLYLVFFVQFLLCAFLLLIMNIMLYIIFISIFICLIVADDSSLFLTSFQEKSEKLALQLVKIYEQTLAKQLQLRSKERNLSQQAGALLNVLQVYHCFPLIFLSDASRLHCFIHCLALLILYHDHDFWNKFNRFVSCSFSSVRSRKVRLYLRPCSVFVTLVKSYWVVLHSHDGRFLIITTQLRSSIL